MSQHIFSFIGKPIDFCQSSHAEIQTFGKVLCIFTRKEAESKLLKVTLRVGILVQNLARYRHGLAESRGAMQTGVC